MADDICPNQGSFFGGCRFEPRYDTRPASPEAVKAAIDSLTAENYEFDPEELAEALSSQQYVRDICTTCGKVIDRR